MGVRLSKRTRFLACSGGSKPISVTLSRAKWRSPPGRPDRRKRYPPCATRNGGSGKERHRCRPAPACNCTAANAESRNRRAVFPVRRRRKWRRFAKRRSIAKLKISSCLRMELAFSISNCSASSMSSCMLRVFKSVRLMTLSVNSAGSFSFTHNGPILDNYVKTYLQK